MRNFHPPRHWIQDAASGTGTGSAAGTVVSVRFSGSIRARTSTGEAMPPQPTDLPPTLPLSLNLLTENFSPGFDRAKKRNHR